MRFSALRKSIICYLMILVMILGPSAVLIPFTSRSVDAVSSEISGQSEGLEQDNTPPSVDITFPEGKTTAPPGKIVVRGTASDTGSGLAKVEAIIHPLPFNNKFPFGLATPKTPGDWSTWSITL